jgi:two-component system response regulator AtoC
LARATDVRLKRRYTFTVPATILVVEDESLLRWSITKRLEQEHHTVVEAGTAAEALEKAGGADLVLLDLKLPDGGLAVLRRIKEQTPDTLVLLMTAYSSIENAVEAMKLGAYHYLNKPFNLDEMALLVDKALETSLLRREVKAFKSSEGREARFDSVIGESAAMKSVKGLLARVASSPASTVLLTGETGTGKDLAAKAIHYNSARASSSGTSGAPSPTRDSRSGGCSRRPTAEPSSWTRSAR